jgi:hypothetical protein
MSVKLTDALLVMMSAAAQRKDRCLSAPATIKGAAFSKVSAKLAKLGLAREIEAKPGAPIWRRDDAGQGLKPHPYSNRLDEPSEFRRRHAGITAVLVDLIAGRLDQNPPFGLKTVQERSFDNQRMRRAD